MNCVQSTQDRRDSNSRRHAIGTDGNTTDTRAVLQALVVDDEPVMRKLAATMLERFGFSVNVSGHGTQALSDFSRAPCDLVLTDFEMPSINGYQLSRKIKSLQPGTRVVIMTGLSRTAVTGLMGDSRIDGWLFKPFCLAELKSILKRVGISAKGYS